MQLRRTQGQFFLALFDLWTRVTAPGLPGDAQSEVLWAQVGRCFVHAENDPAQVPCGMNVDGLEESLFSLTLSPGLWKSL